MTSERRRTGRAPHGRTRIPPGSGRRAARGGALLLALLALALALGAEPAPAASPLSWSAAVPIGGSGTPSAISCASQSLCVAVDSGGSILLTGDPTAAAPAWSSAAKTGQALSSVSCASPALCVAVGGHDAFVSTSGGASWSGPVAADPGGNLSGVSCPGGSLCVAVDEAGQALASSSPAAPNWPAVKIDSGALRAVSCAGASSCVAVDGAGQAFGSEAPAAGAWHGRSVAGGLGLGAVSCSASGPCVALDSAGDALVSENPGSTGATWSTTPIDPGGHPAAASCGASGLCVVVDEHGEALASDDPAAPLPGWSASSAEPGERLTGLSCLPGGVCVALDAAGRSLRARVQPPSVTTSVPAEVTQTTATLSGVIDPRDAVLGACTFEYGTSIGYGQRVACSVSPAPTAGAQFVAATVTGLEPNTTYHYRLVASSLAGSGEGADVTFTTGISSSVPLVFPHPSIHGTPAVGSRLTCQSGTPSGAAQLSFAWLRDLIPIPRANGSTYTVAGTDSGHHLQCQVTARNAGGAATARSAFVTIPIGGVTAAVGETIVGRAHVAKRAVSVPVRCSSRAPGGCRIVIRLSATGRPLLLGSARAHLARGQQRSVALSLTAAGKRALRGRRRTSAKLTVSGTVIGLLESLLSQQRLTLGASARGATRARHASR
jgi:hypothetical protein